MPASERERCVRLRIEGHVQGVGYRYWVKQKAQGSGLRGWVRNRRDATVEAILAGPAGLVGDMIAACERGPVSARVAAVTIVQEDADQSSLPGAGIEMRPTV